MSLEPTLTATYLPCELVKLFKLLRAFRKEMTPAVVVPLGEALDAGSLVVAHLVNVDCHSTRSAISSRLQFLQTRLRVAELPVHDCQSCPQHVSRPSSIRNTHIPSQASESSGIMLALYLWMASASRHESSVWLVYLNRAFVPIMTFINAPTPTDL